MAEEGRGVSAYFVHAALGVVELVRVALDEAPLDPLKREDERADGLLHRPPGVQLLG